MSSDLARLTLATIQKFSDKDDSVINIAEDNTLSISCPVPYSEPEPIVDFYKNNVRINNNTNLVNGRTMVIRNVKLSDSGMYHCTANNYISQQTFVSNCRTIVIVYTNKTFRAPHFIKQLQTEYVVLRGKNVTLECTAAGYPIPNVTWSRLDGSPLSKSVTSPVGLTIIHVQPSDRGEYDCEWSNEIGKVKSVIILKVVEPPKVMKQPKESTVTEGDGIELSCNVTGEPEPTIEWLVNGESFVPSRNIKIEGSSLSISAVQKKHAGFIQCVASNMYGSHSGYSVLWVNPKQRLAGNKTTEVKPYGTMSKHKHTKGGGRRRNKEGKRKGTGNYLFCLRYHCLPAFSYQMYVHFVVSNV